MKIKMFVLFLLLVQKGFAQDRVCEAVNKILADVPAQFKNLKGNLEDEYEGTKYYALKTIPEGWAYGSYVVERKNISLMLSAGTDETEAEGMKRFRAVSKELASCLSLTGKEEKDSFENPVTVFTSKGAKFTLKLTAMDGKYNTNMTVVTGK